MEGYQRPDEETRSRTGKRYFQSDIIKTLEELDATCEEKDSEENDPCVSASFFYREWEESKGKIEFHL